MSNSSEFMECCGEVVSWTKWGDGNHGMVHKIRRVSNGKTTWPNYVGISWVLPSCEFVGLWEYQTWTKCRLPSETEWREHRENHVYWTSSHISSAHHQLQASSEIHNCFSHILSHIGDPSVHCKVTVKMHSISHASFLSHFPWILPLISPPSFRSLQLFLNCVSSMTTNVSLSCYWYCYIDLRSSSYECSKAAGGIFAMPGKWFGNMCLNMLRPRLSLAAKTHY